MPVSFELMFLCSARTLGCVLAAILIPLPVKQAADFVKQQFAALSGKCGEMGEVRKNLKSVKVEEGRLSITCGK